MICNNPNQDIVKSINGHNYITNFRKMTGNNPNLDLVNIKTHKRFGQILSISSDISQGP